MTEHPDGDRDDPEQRTIRDLMDPAALEARLVIARARRAEVLAARAKGVEDAPDERRPRMPRGDTAPDALMPLRRLRAAEAAASGNQSLSSPPAAGEMEVPAAHGRRNPVADTARLVARPSADGSHDLDRRMPAPLKAIPGEFAHPVAPDRAPSRRRRSATLVGAMVLSGIALGAVSTLILQTRGWQIAIVPPAAEGAREPTAKPETGPVETAGAEQAARPPSRKVEDPAVGPSGSAAGVTKPSVTADAPGRIPKVATAAEPSPAVVVERTAEPSSRVASPPVLPPERSVGALDTDLDGLPQPAPVPDAETSEPALSSDEDPAALSELPKVATAAEPSPAVVVERAAEPSLRVASPPALPPERSDGALDAKLDGVLQRAPVAGGETSEPTLSFDMDPAALSKLPGDAEPERPILTGGMAARSPQLLIPQNDAGPSPLPPPEDAGPDAAIVSPSSRVSVHFPAVSSAKADEVSAKLTGAGFADVAARPVSFSISSPHVRYYHDVDRAAAEEVAASTSAALDGAAVEVRSFTDFQPQPEEGLVEVWLAGKAAPPVPSAAATPSRKSVVPNRAVAQEAARRAADQEAARRAADQEAKRQRLLGTVEQRLRSRLR